MECGGRVSDALASPDNSSCSTRRAAGAAARRATAPREAWLASAFPPSEVPIGGVVELLTVNGVPDEGVEAAMASKKRGGESEALPVRTRREADTADNLREVEYWEAAAP